MVTHLCQERVRQGGPGPLALSAAATLPRSAPSPPRACVGQEHKNRASQRAREAACWFPTGLTRVTL